MTRRRQDDGEEGSTVGHIADLVEQAKQVGGKYAGGGKQAEDQVTDRELQDQREDKSEYGK